jgi:hypothetical protein
MPVILGIASILVFVIVINLIKKIIQHQSTRARSELAKNLDLLFTVEQNPAEHSIPGNFVLFNQGVPYKNQNIMEGRYKSTPVKIYDYEFNTDLGKYQGVFRQTVFQIKSERVSFPQFTLCPQDQIDAISRNIQSPESKESLRVTAGIRLLEHPEFRKQYKLLGYEPQILQNIFDSNRVIETLAVIDVKPFAGSICIEGYGEYVIVYPLYMRVAAKDIVNFLENSIDIFQSIENTVSHLT